MKLVRLYESLERGKSMHASLKEIYKKEITELEKEWLEYIGWK